MSTERCAVQQLEGGIVEELLVDDGEAAEVMAPQERTFRARAGRVVQPSGRADAEWTLSGFTPYRYGVAGSAQEQRSLPPSSRSTRGRRGSSRLAAQRDVVERKRVAAPVAGTVMDQQVYTRSGVVAAGQRLMDYLLTPIVESLGRALREE